METKTKKAEETKNRILSSAQKLFHKKGFEATSIREIVEEAGCAKGTFYLYFETKMDLLIYISNALFKNFNDIIIEHFSNFGEDPFEQINDIFDALCIHMQEKEGSLKLFHSREILDLIIENGITKSFINSIIAQITAFLKTGMERGCFRQVDPELYGKMIFSIGHDVLESAMLHSFPADIDRVKTELMTMIRKILEK